MTHRTMNCVEFRKFSFEKWCSTFFCVLWHKWHTEKYEEEEEGKRKRRLCQCCLNWFASGKVRFNRPTIHLSHQSKNCTQFVNFSIYPIFFTRQTSSTTELKFFFIRIIVNPKKNLFNIFQSNSVILLMLPTAKCVWI